MTRNATTTAVTARTSGLGRTLAGADTSVGRGCLVTPRAGSANLHRAAVNRSEHGSALILVLVCLVMMVLIGTAYIQVARVDRRATAQLTGVNNLDTVRDAVIAYVGKILKEDMLDASSNFFSAANYDEAFDAPITNTSVSYPVTSGRSDTLGNSLGSAVGGQFDDTWLADAFIDEASGQGSGTESHPSWRQISDVNGIYLSLPASGGAQTLPLEHVVAATGADTSGVGLAGASALVSAWGGGGSVTSDLNVASGAGYDKRGFDNDGDGILDSRWTWAPEEVRQIGALSYVVAYRIIDLSSMINVNVATGTHANADATPADSRGYFPTDQSLTRIFGKSRTGYLSEIANIHTVRGLTAPPLLSGTVGSLATVPVTFTGRELAWESPTVGAKYYGYSNNKFALEDELELRSKGGLNTATATPLENAAFGMLRRDPPPLPAAQTENTYLDIPSVNQYSDGWSAHAYFHGGHWSMLPSQYPMYNANRKYWATRHMFTTTSGASIIAPQYAGWTPGVDSLDRLKYDLVHRGSSDSSVSLTSVQRATEIRDRLEKILKIGSPKYLNITDDAKIRQIATEFAVNIVDYSDADNTPTALSDGDKTYYGLEALPFLREVYVEAQYEAKDTDTDPLTYEEWVLIPQTLGIAIEIGNPFDIPLTFGSGSDNGAQVKIRIMQGTPAAPIQVAEQTISPAMVIPPRDPATTHGHIAVYHSGSTKGEPTANGGGGQAIAGTNSLALSASGLAGTRIVEMGPDLIAALTTNTDIYIELSVTCSDGKEVAYDRLWPAAGQEFQIKDKIAGTGDLTTPKKEYAQLSLRRDGRKNRYLSNRGRTMPTPISPQDGAYKNGTLFAQFSKEDKGATGDSNLDKIQVAHPNHRFFNVAELGYVFMWGFYEDKDTAEGDFVTRMSGRDGAKGPGTTTDVNDVACAARQFLSFTNTGTSSGTYIVPSATKIPHFSMIMDQFTTLSPRYNAKDEDNDDSDMNISTGADNSAEQFVPGTMNVNTAPWWLMALASPIPEAMSTTDGNSDIEVFYRTIGLYRDFPANRATYTGLPAASLRSDPASDKGIASLGELLLIRGQTAGAGAGTVTDTQRYGNTTTALAATSPLRHYPHPDHPTARTFDEDYAAQERMARFQYLSSSLSTRSDRYCAYITIRGYTSDAFNQAPAESLKFFVIFDRSGIIDIDSPVIVYPKTGQKN